MNKLPNLAKARLDARTPRVGDIFVWADCRVRPMTYLFLLHVASAGGPSIFYLDILNMQTREKYKVFVGEDEMIHYRPVVRI